MQFDKVTAELFDKTMSNWEEDGVQCHLESIACSDLVEESLLAGRLAKQALQLLMGEVNSGGQRRVLAGVFGYGLRYGWHLRRLLQAREDLDGMLSVEEAEALRREIREKA